MGKLKKKIIDGWEVPEKDCMFLGKCCNGRIVCDGAGDDVSPEFCRYCQYIAETYGVKPYRFAEKFFWGLNDIIQESKKKGGC